MCATCAIGHADAITLIFFKNSHKAPPKSLGRLRLRELRRQPFILLSFSSSKKLRKSQETQSYQRIQCIGHTDFNTSGTNGPHSLLRMKVGTHSPLPTGSHTAAYTPKQGLFRMGALLLPSERFTHFGNPAWPGVRTANFAAFAP